MKTILFSWILLIAMAQSCDKDKKKSTNLMKELNIVEVFEVDQFATPKPEQIVSKEYLSDYQLIKKINLDSTILRTLKIVASDTSTYSQQSIKACPFIANYAIAFRNDKQQYIHLIISKKNCGKCQVFSSDTSLVKYLDIVNQQLYSLIEIGK